MVVKHRRADVTYRWDDRMREQGAFAAAIQSGTAPDFSGFEGNQYAVLVTFRRDGTPVPTPVWFALLGDRRLVIGTDLRTAKVRRTRPPTGSGPPAPRRRRGGFRGTRGASRSDLPSRARRG